MGKQQSLSQEELAEFTQALSVTGKATKTGALSREVKSYDFTRPEKLSKAHLKAIQLILSSVERQWSSAISQMMKAEAAVTFETVEQATMEAYEESLPLPSANVVLSMGRLPGNCVISLPAAFALTFVDRLAGGKGELLGEPRELTNVERRVIRKVFERLINDLANAWKPILPMQLTVKSVTCTAGDTDIPYEESVLVGTYSWAIGEAQHKVNFAMPVNALEGSWDLLTPEHWYKGKSQTEASPAPFMTNLLAPVEVETVVELGHAKVSMHEVVGLGVGDVIRLDRPISEPLDVKIQGKLKFRANPGLAGKQIAVHITEQISKAERGSAVAGLSAGQ